MNEPLRHEFHTQLAEIVSHGHPIDAMKFPGDVRRMNPRNLSDIVQRNRLAKRILKQSLYPAHPSRGVAGLVEASSKPSAQQLQKSSFHDQVRKRIRTLELLIHLERQATQIARRRDAGAVRVGVGDFQSIAD